MAALSLVDLARALVDIDSTTGREAEACAWLGGYLRTRGFHVTEQPVSEGRTNIVALVDPKPAVVLSTHIDCVPPFFPSHVEGGRLYGRGACDAKGALAAQVTAAERLREAGEERVGLLFVVGEERGSDGAAAANAISPGPAFLVNGEPTESKLGLATRGAFRVRLRATGRAAHSSQPERGISAIDRLIDALVELRGIALPEDPQLGRTFYATGLISGGIAPNVISPLGRGRAQLPDGRPGLRGPRAPGAPAARGWRSRRCSRSRPCGCGRCPASRPRRSPSRPTSRCSIAGEQPLLFGPGSVVDAHTDGDNVELADLEAAALAYESIARTLLREARGAAGLSR